MSKHSRNIWYFLKTPSISTLLCFLGVKRCRLFVPRLIVMDGVISGIGTLFSLDRKALQVFQI